MKINIFAALLLAASPAFSGETTTELEKIGAEDYFTGALDQALPPAPADAFAGLRACRAADARLLRPIGRREAVDMLKPCAEALSSRYNLPIAVRVGRMGSARARSSVPVIEFVLGRLPELGSPALRDLQLALSLRGDRLLGHRARARVGNPLEPRYASALQKAVDTCITATIVRPMSSSREFIALYGRCIKSEASLQVTALAPAEDEMTVLVWTPADSGALDALDGTVTVPGEEGAMAFTVEALAEGERP